MAQTMLVTETRLDNKSSSELIDYFKNYVPQFSKIGRYVWQKIKHDGCISNKSALNTEIQHKFGVTKRTANSVISDMQGRYKALRELKKTELQGVNGKISALTEKINKLSLTVNAISIKASKNELSTEQLISYRKLKQQLWQRKQRLNRLNNEARQLQTDIEQSKVSLGFGSKKMFRTQYLLEKNGYKTHNKWLNDYRKRRDANIFYLGSKDETSGNQMFQLSANTDGTFIIKVRKDADFVDTDKYVTGTCTFKYLADELRNILINKDKPITYRVKIRDNKVYVQAMFSLDSVDRPIITTMLDGAIGIDFNSGHLDISETDSKGNLIGIKSFSLQYHGGSAKAENEMCQVLAKIGRYALLTGKSLVKEDLSFQRKKSKTLRSKGKQGKDYNRMLHTLDYSRYDERIVTMCIRNGIDLVEVNPAYTSQIAKQKYCNQRSIPIHNGAAYVIARRGQRFSDKLVA